MLFLSGDATTYVLYRVFPKHASRAAAAGGDFRMPGKGPEWVVIPGRRASIVRRNIDHIPTNAGVSRGPGQRRISASAAARAAHCSSVPTVMRKNCAMRGARAK